MKIVGAVMGAIDSAGNFARTCHDEITGNICSISTEHHEIHEENHYTCQDDDQNVDTAAAKYWHFKTPAATPIAHFIFSMAAAASGTVELFEAPTLGGDGTPLTIYNNDRNSANTSSMLAYKDPTVSADGSARLVVNIVGGDGTGAAGGQGGIMLRDNEINLKVSTSYVAKFTTEADNNRVSCCFEFYEED